jgi:hypothetical protein
MLALGACSNDSKSTDAGSTPSSTPDTPDETKAKANIQAAVLDDKSSITGGTKATQEQAQCIADGMVDDVGIDTLQKYKLLDDKLEINSDANPTNMDAADADALAGVFVGCIDVEKMFTDQFNSGDQKLPEDQQNCIKDAIDEDAMKAGLSASFQGKQDEGFTQMQANMMKCVTG